MTSSAIDQLRHILSAELWSADPETIAPHLVEWRDRFRGRTPLMLLPRSTADVARMLGACNELGVGVVPQGGHTGLVGGAMPDTSGEQVLLSLRRLNRVRDINPTENTLTAEAGCLLADLQQAAASVQRYFPLSLASEGSSQIGGNLSTNAGGINVLRYGNARDQVLGLEVVLPDGGVLDVLRALRKDTAGYDLKNLFIGAEGTLGVITAAVLKLQARHRTRVTVMLAQSRLEDAFAVLDAGRGVPGLELLALELIPRIGLELVCRHIPGARPPLPLAAPWYLLVELGSFLGDADTSRRVEDWLQRLLGERHAVDGVLASSQSQAQALWQLRESMSEAQKRESVGLKHDVSVPVSNIPALVRGAQERIQRLSPGARTVAFGHVGDGNVHLNVLPPRRGDTEAFLADGAAVTASIYTLVESLGGSFSAEHGIGQLKQAELARFRSPVELALMRTVKRTLDPKGIMNPGKLLPPEPASNH
jgi:FAD/FMN-containing dehydrogenase